jgi:hypothetical protein
MTTEEARALARAARLVQGNQRTAKALAAGDVSVTHVRVAARAARHVEDLYGEHEDVILDAARALAPEDFRTVMSAWRSQAENLVGREPAAARCTRRHLHISPVLDSMTRIDGWVDAETGARFAQALDTLAPPDPLEGPEPPRSLGQRRADALATLVARGGARTARRSPARFTPRSGAAGVGSSRRTRGRQLLAALLCCFCWPYPCFRCGWGLVTRATAPTPTPAARLTICCRRALAPASTPPSS